MAQPDDSSDFLSPSAEDVAFRQARDRLHQLTVYARWTAVAMLWLCVAPISLWSLRSEIQLWQTYFTWTAVRFTIAYNPIPSVGLSLCIGATVSVLLWQSRNILFGFSSHHDRWLKQQLWKIRQQGTSHPLWRWVYQEPEKLL